jgi:hypothetical protein
MANSQIKIADMAFEEAVLEYLLIDLWLGVVELIVGDTSIWRASGRKGRRFQFGFTGVSEVRGWREPLSEGRFDQWQPSEPFQTEEVLGAGQVEHTSDVGLDDQRYYRLLQPVVRDPDGTTEGLRWSISRDRPPKLAWIRTWQSYIEFLYSGDVTTQELSEEQRNVVQHIQWQRSHKPPPD